MSDPAVVLDTSALLALLNADPVLGADLTIPPFP
jgi:hypothetical protein